ncbi:iron-containing redox enzyme family protein, partial [Streptomyces gardneri]
MTPPSPSAPEATTGPRLAAARGDLSSAVERALRSDRPPAYTEASIRRADPWGEDLQLALYLLY